MNFSLWHKEKSRYIIMKDFSTDVSHLFLIFSFNGQRDVVLSFHVSHACLKPWSAIMVIHETNDGQIFDAWEHVNFDAIQTSLEVFKCLEADGFPIKYARVPILLLFSIARWAEEGQPLAL
ncbi:uncharacterized protein LOC133816601 [Humulus lupulus]|uniref:uncharacterized protein LOC133816601 n=1 Tax=Humulus lupulus TaxID=3486 RepID=UPI002B417D97|nr:uncharacterized protein LOC133816601 [Humulus lupulus]